MATAAIKAGSKGTRTQGATRKQQAAPVAKRNYSVWLNRLLILTGGAVVVAAAVQGFIYLRAIPVEHIMITGQLEHLQRDEVKEMLQPTLVGGFLSADLGRIRSELESLPWVYEVSVRRRWPNALEINVVEQLPIARWGEDGFLNHSGEVFQTNRAGDWASLPALRGPDGTARDLMASYLRLLDLLQPLRLDIEELQVDQRGQLQARLEGGVLLMIGNNEFIARLQRLVAIYPAHLGPRSGEIIRIDLRYESGLAVEFAEPEQDTPATRMAGL